MTQDVKPDDGASQHPRPAHVLAMNPSHPNICPPVEEASTIAPKLINHHPPQRRNIEPPTTNRHDGSLLPSPEPTNTPASVSLPALGPPTACVGLDAPEASRPVEQGEHGYTVNDYQFVRMYVRLAKARRSIGRIYSRDKLRFMQSVKRSLRQQIKKTRARRVASGAAGIEDVSLPPEA